ncbi:hypothetical protein [Geosporobacter ferrireducens]|uniref:hypothetical protein n=1 Tax=Geosporobacter ferrireducens TaxID=1424294 RepID=UPI00139B0796|nr:hypothetical protein [Geosporobacter ferrireducens]MTI57467.1 hypothetical protein [Geosporobacter ferrireducens]
MKRILSTALLLTLSTSLFTSPVSAKELDKQEDLGDVLSVRQEIEWDVLEGTIKEIGDFNWVVEDLEGKEYTVPVLGIKDLEEYQAADVQVGQKVSITGKDLSKLESGQMVRIARNGSQLDANEGDLDLNVAKTREIKDALISTFETKGELKVEAMRIDKDKLEEIKAKGGDIVLKELKEDIDPEKIKEFGNIRVFEKGQELSGELKERLGKAFKIDEEGTETMAVKGAPIGGDVFLPQEITVNNRTISLPQMMIKAIPAALTLE